MINITYIDFTEAVRHYYTPEGKIIIEKANLESWEERIRERKSSMGPRDFVLSGFDRMLKEIEKYLDIH